VLAAGFAIGALLSRTAENIPAPRLARIYYALVAALLILRTVGFGWTMLEGHPAFVSTVMGLIGDLLNLIFGAVFGLAARRRDARANP